MSSSTNAVAPRASDGQSAITGHINKKKIAQAEANTLKVKLKIDKQLNTAEEEIQRAEYLLTLAKAEDVAERRKMVEAKNNTRRKRGEWKKKRDANESPNTRKARLQKKSAAAKRARELIRANETPAEREARLKKERDYKKTDYKKRDYKKFSFKTPKYAETSTSSDDTTPTEIVKTRERETGRKKTKTPKYAETSSSD